MENVQDETFSGMFGGFLLGLGISDFAIPIGIVLWLIAISPKLHEDFIGEPFAAFDYVLFVMVAGITLVIALPEGYAKISTKTRLIALMLFALVGGLRWVVFYNKTAKK